VWNVGTGYFGCRTPDGDFCPEMFKKTASQEFVKMIEIKLSQGAKVGLAHFSPGSLKFDFCFCNF
jgi:glutamate synthase domain-containing protein 2